MVTENYKKAVILDNLVEAQLLKSILEEKQIPFMVRSFHDTAYNGLYQMQKGMELILAPEEYHEEIQSIYQDILQYRNQNHNEEVWNDPELPTQ